MYKHEYYSSRREEFYVIFGRSTTRMGRLLKKNYGHVCVIQLKGNNTGVKLDPTPHGLETAMLDITKTLPLLINGGELSHKILKVTNTRLNSFERTFQINSCISFVLYAMGLRYSWCFTPYQLYKRLLKESKGAGLWVEQIK